MSPKKKSPKKSAKASRFAQPKKLPPGIGPRIGSLNDWIYMWKWSLDAGVTAAVLHSYQKYIIKYVSKSIPVYSLFSGGKAKGKAVYTWTIELSPKGNNFILSVHIALVPPEGAQVTMGEGSPVSPKQPPPPAIG
jgi:hypothetical protein